MPKAFEPVSDFALTARSSLPNATLSLVLG